MERNKIYFYCRHCRKSMKIGYSASGNADALVFGDLEMACHTKKCTRVIILKKQTEGMILAQADKDGKVFI